MGAQVLGSRFAFAEQQSFILQREEYLSILICVRQQRH